MDNKSNPLITSPAPYIGTGETPRTMFIDVLIALSPSVLVGIFSFGLRALLIMAIGTVFAYIFDAVYGMLIRERHVGDLSPLVTGLMLSMTLPAGAPLWLPVLGSFIAVIAVRRLTGGLGYNIFNPALGARAVLLILFPVSMSLYCAPRSSFLWLSMTDAMTTATPLTTYRLGILSDLWTMFIGQTAGAIGAVSAMAILTGGAYLIIRRVIKWQIPAGFIGAAALYALIFPHGFSPVYSAVHQILAGGTLFCAFFMATDPVTSPVTPLGRLIYGVGCGILTMLIRSAGSYSDGAAFAVLIMNSLSWFIDLKLCARFNSFKNSSVKLKRRTSESRYSAEKNTEAIK